MVRLTDSRYVCPGILAKRRQTLQGLAMFRTRIGYYTKFGVRHVVSFARGQPSLRDNDIITDSNMLATYIRDRRFYLMKKLGLIRLWKEPAGGPLQHWFVPAIRGSRKYFGSDHHFLVDWS